MVGPMYTGRAIPWHVKKLMSFVDRSRVLKPGGIRQVTFFIRKLFYVDGPKGRTKTVSHTKGVLDQWTSRLGTVG